MASGLVGLLDDVAALARLAATSVDDVGAAAGRATSTAAGVLIDDAAVTPQYVHGLAARRELPIIKEIAKGSFRNKLLIVVPALLVLSEFLPVLLTPLLMLGGAYLCYEAAHKIHGRLTGHDHDGHPEQAGTKDEEKVIADAIRTDLILSAEIMVIALNEVADEGFVSRAAILFLVAIIITVMVYGVVALIVKTDDFGLTLVEDGGARAAIGRRLVTGMPKVLTLLTVVGTAAMLWVGGHIELVGMHEFGFDLLYDPIHELEESVREAVGGFAAWLTNTVFSALVGLVVGAIIVGVLQLVRGEDAAHASSH